MLDTNVGPAGREPPSREEISNFHRWFLECGRMLDGTAVDGLFVPERHGRTDCFSPAPLDLLAALAGSTQKVRLGTYVLMPPLYPSLALLERLAVVDHLSGGRLICGVGAGFHPRYFDVHERSLEDRGRALDGWLDAMETGWTHGHVTVEDEEIYVIPPAQTPRPPLWIGGTGKRAIRRAAHRADAFAVGFTDQRLTGLLDDYRQECEKVGRESHLVLLQSAWVRARADARQEAVAELGEIIEPEIRLYRDHGQVRAPSDITIERILPYMYVGNSDEVTRHIREDARRWGIDYAILRVHIGIPPREAVSECLTLIAEKVAPALA